MPKRLGVDTIQRERVEVNIQVERRAEALDESNRAALLGPDSPLPLHPPSKLREQGSEEGAKHGARELRVVGTAVTEGIGQRKHPLPNRDLGQDSIDQVRGGICHSTSAAGRAETAALAREGNQAVMAAVVAVETEEAVRQNAAAKE